MLKDLKFHTFFDKIILLFASCLASRWNNDKIYKEKDSAKILKIFALTGNI